MNESLFITPISIIWNKFLLNSYSSIGVFFLLAVIGFGLIVSPVAISASSSGNFPDIRKAKIGVKDDIIKNIFIETKGEIPTDGSAGTFGYGVIFPNGKAIVTTTHAGTLDTEDQKGSLDPIWHNHFVKLDPANQACLDEGLSGVAIADITFESPGQVIIDKNTALLKNLPESAPSLFNMGQDITPGEYLDGDGVVAVFVIIAILGIIHSNPLVAVCIDDIQPVDDGYKDIYEISHNYYNEHDYNEEESYYDDADRRHR